MGRSSKWDCNDFVRDHLWDFCEREGIKSFYDVVHLPGGSIAKCVEVAKTVKVLMVVLDDEAPTEWMAREIEAAIEHGVLVQTIYREDLFKWDEVGKETWRQKS